MERLEEVIAELRLVRKEIARIGADVGDVKEIMVDMMEGKRQQRKKDAERKRTKRERDAEERLQGKIPLPDCCPVEVRDKRLEARGDFLHWAHVGMEFGRDNDVRGFFTYLALAWNQTVYHEKVITRSGNRPHIWRGNVRRRSPETWSSIFGTMTGRVTDLVLADLSGQAWFAWGFAVFYPVWQEMQTLPGFAQLPDRFSQACLLVQGGFGGYCINADTDLYFDPNNSMEDLKLMRRFVPALWYAWGACKEGLEIASFRDWKAPYDDMLKKAGDAYEKTRRTRAREAAGKIFLDKLKAQRRLEMMAAVALPSPAEVEELALKRAISLSLEDQQESREPAVGSPRLEPSRPRNPDDTETKTPEP